MNIKNLAVLLILFLLTVPVQAQKMTEAQNTDMEQSVKAKVKQLYDAFDSMKVENYVQLWSRDKSIGVLTPTGLVATPEALSKLYQSDYANQKSHKNENIDIKVQIFSPEMAFAFGKTTVRIERTSGNIENYNVADVSIWFKEIGDWKLAYFSFAAGPRK
jgi:ketosteroid isomerase-like protein